MFKNLSFAYLKAILERLREVFYFYVRGLVQVGDGLGHFQYPVVAAGGDKTFLERFL